jgi:glycosyltransferase involved in cell wall biosynthesis
MTQNNPLASITAVIPARNAAPTISDCLEAMLNVLPPEQIILVDDASEDSTAELVKKTNVRVLSLESNSGAAAARNRGLRFAQTEFVLFCDADVLIQPNGLLGALETLSNRSDIGGIQGVYSKKTTDDNPCTQYKHFQQLENIFALPEAKTPVLGTAIALVRKSTVLQVGGFDDAITGASIEDRLLGQKLWALGMPMLLQRSLVGIHAHSWNLKPLISTDFRRARDEISHHSALGEAGRYVNTRKRLTYSLFVFSLALCVIGLAWNAILHIGLFGIGLAVLIDNIFVAKTGRCWTPVWIVVSFIDQLAISAGALWGFSSALLRFLPRHSKETQTEASV